MISSDIGVSFPVVVLHFKVKVQILKSFGKYPVTSILIIEIYDTAGTPLCEIVKNKCYESIFKTNIQFYCFFCCMSDSMTDALV